MLRNATLYVLLAFVFVFIIHTFTSGFGRETTPVEGNGRPDFWKQPSHQSNGSAIEEFEKPGLNWTSSQEPVPQEPVPSKDAETNQLIDRLIGEANTTFDNLLARRSLTLENAAQAYRERRDRHPPPGFDEWFDYAQEHDAIIVEDFWDQIYDDLEPFWALPPAQIRAQARAAGMAVYTKEGQAFTDTDWFWHVIWKNMMQEVAYMLPDMLIPLNPMDEPRLMVPFKDISAYVAKADHEKLMPKASEVVQRTAGWNVGSETSVETPKVDWIDRGAPYSWARQACPPDSPIQSDMEVMYAHRASTGESVSNTVVDSTKIFAENSTFASDSCSDPAIADYHAALTSPLTLSVSQTLQPLFGGSKLSVNNDILLPAPMYWNGEERFDQGDVTPWSQKSNAIVWRGTATGGRHDAFNWPHFQRLRFVALTNGTKYSTMDGTYDRVFPPAQRQLAVDPLPLSLQANLSTYLEQTQNVGFTELFCDVPQEEGKCWYLDTQFQVVDVVTLAEQYRHKIIPDIDGNSFSGRYRSFLLSNSLPFKATLFREWHDSRLVAWKHFVPMNNRFTDYYALLAYFLGCNKDICGSDGMVAAHDAEAEMIATAGSEWAKKVLRKEDMQIYVARLLLEYGRITDDNRMWTGWVDDLLPETGNFTSETVEE